jgi:hypothetical protein
VGCPGARRRSSPRAMTAGHGRGVGLAMGLAAALAGCDHTPVDLLATPVIHFRGADGRVRVPNNALLAFADQFTLEAWVRLDDGAGGMLFDKWQQDWEDKSIGFVAGEAPLLQAAFFVAANDTLAISGPSLSVGKWHHLAFQRGAGLLRVFVDGAQSASLPAPAPVANGQSDLVLGAFSRGAAQPAFAGYVTELRLSSVARYDGAFAPAGRLRTDAQTTALWHLDDGAGGFAADSGPHHLDAALSGAVEWAFAPPAARGSR